MPLVRRQTLRAGAPTLVLLHGLGSNADDLFSLAGPIAGDFSIVALQAPDPYFEGFSWFPIDYEPGGIRIDVETAHARARLVIDELAGLTGPIILVGFSQGTMLSSLILAENPEAVDGAILMAGALLPGVTPQAGERRPVLILHGRQDPVVPFEAGEAMRDAFATLHEVRFIADNVGHTVSMPQLFALATWLQESFPRDTSGVAQGTKSPQPVF